VYIPEVLKMWSAPPGSAPFVLWGVDFMRHIFILNYIWVQGKIYILIGTLLG
jgi:hypothetical protein